MECISKTLQELYWESTYAIASTLMEVHPQVDPEQVGLFELIDLIQNLPGFQDDPALVTEQMLLDIQTVWYEERTSI